MVLEKVAGVERERRAQDSRKREVDNYDETEANVATRRLGVRCTAFWCWDEKDKSPEARLGGLNNTVVTFHPHWSNGTAGVRASQPVVNYGVNYWEIEVGDRVFGTSQMFGVSTKRARLHVNDFKHLLGEDENSWGMSHQGHLYHNGESISYCSPFAEYTPVTVGVLLDMDKGELAFFKNGRSLGVAFTSLHQVEEDLYPTVCSTAVKTVMSIGRNLRTFTDLKDNCRHVITSAILSKSCESNEKLVENIHTLPVPDRIKKYLLLSHNIRK